MRNTDLYLKKKKKKKKLQLERLVAVCSQTTQTSVKVGKTRRRLYSHRFYSEHRKVYQSKLSTDHPSDERSFEIVEVTSLKWPETATKQTSVTTQGMISVVWAFLKKYSFLSQKETAQLVFSVFFFLINTAFSYSEVLTNHYITNRLLKNTVNIQVFSKLLRYKGHYYQFSVKLLIYSRVQMASF